MGIELPPPGDGEMCEWDNELFPPGQTPKFWMLNFAGIMARTRPPLPPCGPWNGAVLVTQTSGYTWERLGVEEHTILVMAPDYLNIQHGRKGQHFQFAGVEPFLWKCDNSQHLADEYSWGEGSCSYYASSGIAAIAAAFTVGSGSPAFLEMQTPSFRLAEERQSTCIYIKPK
jgi:hypothetical protein